ncbi:hypothetical protein ACYOEI_16555 [Singulisphaera rosea]
MQFRLVGYQKLIAVVALVLLAIRARILNEYSPILNCAALVACLASCLTTSRWITILTWISACYPILSTLAIVGTWLIAAIELGHLPRPNLDDPTNIGRVTTTSHALTWIALHLAPEMLILSLVAVIFRLLESSRQAINNDKPEFQQHTTILIHLLIAFAPWMAAISFSAWDPGWIATWFFG